MSTSNILIIFYCLFFTFLAWRYFKYALIFVVLALPSYLIRFSIGLPAQAGWLPMTLLEAMILIIFVIWVIRKYKHTFCHPEERTTGATKDLLDSSLHFITLRMTMQKDLFQFIVPISLFLISSFISMFVAPDLRAAAGIWKAYFLEPIIFFFIFIDTIKSKKDLELVLSALGVSAFILSIICFYQKFTGNFIYEPIWQPEAVRRVTGFYTSPNAVALYLVPILVLLFGYLVYLVNITKTRKHSPDQVGLKTQKQFNSDGVFVFLCFCVFVAGVLAVYFTKSRGGIIALIIALLVVSFFGISKKWTSVVIILGALAIFLNLASREYIIKLATFKDFSGYLRVILWHGTTNLIKARPLFGAGLAGFAKTLSLYAPPKYFEELIYPHNILLNFWVETGLLGVVSFFWLFFAAVKNSWNSFKKDISPFVRYISLGTLGALLTILIHGLVDVSYFKNDLAMLFWILVGMIISIHKLSDSPLSAIWS